MSHTQEFSGKSHDVNIDEKKNAELISFAQKKDNNLYAYYCLTGGLPENIHKYDQLLTMVEI